MAMNPFTRFLSQWSKDQPLHEFIRHWDTLEALAIRVYKNGRASAEDEVKHQEARAALQKMYPVLSDKLRPYWQQARVAGHPEHDDPFDFLLSPSQAADFVGNWAALQHLPAAREALNQLLVKEASDAT